jgi:hypothetical protein
VTRAAGSFLGFFGLGLVFFFLIYKMRYLQPYQDSWQGNGEMKILTPHW